MQPKVAEQREETPEEEQARVFAKLKEMKVAEEPAEDEADEQPAYEEPVERRRRGQRGDEEPRRAAGEAGKPAASRHRHATSSRAS